jgi:hypothetical protein
MLMSLEDFGLTLPDPPKRMVACERGDGTLNVHAESTTCEVCSPSNFCAHDWNEAVDADGNLIEPAYDICVNCGERRD